MDIIFYSSDFNGFTEIYKRTIETAAPEARIEIFSNLQKLSERLERPMGDKSIVIILVLKKEQIFDIFALRELLFPIKLILILPDAEKETVSLGHRLHPNFLTYVRKDPTRLSAVLSKLKNADGAGGQDDSRISDDG